MLPWAVAGYKLIDSLCLRPAADAPYLEKMLNRTTWKHFFILLIFIVGYPATLPCASKDIINGGLRIERWLELVFLMGDARDLEMVTRASLFSEKGQLIETIRNNAAPGATCLVDVATSTALTYAQLLGAVDEIARTFQSDGRKLAFLVARNTLDTVVAYLALIQAGHVVCLWNATTDSEALQRSVQLYSPFFVVNSPVTLASGYKCLRLRHGIQAAVSCQDSALLIDERTALLLTTSGSTGSSKLVRLSHRNISSNACSIARYLEISPADRAITMLPLSYSYGLSVLHSHLICGASIVLNEEPVVTRDFWDAFKTHECSSLVGVPHTHQTLLKMGIYRRPPTCLRYVTQAGGRLDAAMASEIHTSLLQHRIPFFVMYGQTEATARISYLPPEYLPKRPGSIGIAIPGGTLSVVNELGEQCRALEVGQISYCGPNVMMGYADGPADLARGDDLNGQLLTGDLGFYDEAGFFFLTGRVKRIAKILGMRVNLDEVEAFLAKYFPAAVVERAGKISCFVEKADSAEINQIQNILRDKLILSGDSINIQVVEKLPRTANGKLDYPKLEVI